MNDMESMYCSKLIYHTFKKYVSLNSDNTCAFKDRLNTPGAVAYSWVGVSPDDNYYADALGHDFSYSDNVNHL